MYTKASAASTARIKAEMLVLDDGGLEHSREEMWKMTYTLSLEPDFLHFSVRFSNKCHCNKIPFPLMNLII